MGGPWPWRRGRGRAGARQHGGLTQDEERKAAEARLRWENERRLAAWERAEQERKRLEDRSMGLDDVVRGLEAEDVRVRSGESAKAETAEVERILQDWAAMVGATEGVVARARTLVRAIYRQPSQFDISPLVTDAAAALDREVTAYTRMREMTAQRATIAQEHEQAPPVQPEPDVANGGNAGPPDDVQAIPEGMESLPLWPHEARYLLSLLLADTLRENRREIHRWGSLGARLSRLIWR